MVKMNSFRELFAERLNTACNQAGVRDHGRAVDIRKALLKKYSVRVTTTAIGKWLKADSTPEHDKIVALADWLNVRAEWLEYGLGNMRESGNNELIEKVNHWDDSDPLSEDEISIPFYKSIPHGTTAMQCDYKDPDGMIRLSKFDVSQANANPKFTFSFQSPDNSMEPIIRDGATVAIDTSNTAIKNGKIYVIQYGEMYLIRSLFSLPNNRVRIKCAHDDYPDEQIEQREIQVIGKVFYTASVID